MLASHTTETHAICFLLMSCNSAIHRNVPALTGIARLMKRLPGAILFTASFSLLSARGRVWTSGLPPKGPAGTPTPGFCPAIGSGVSHRCVNHKEGKWSGGRLGPRWMPLPEKALPGRGRAASSPTARPVTPAVSMVRRGATAPAQIWSIAGLKTAGAKIWGPLTKVVTPQKLFLFVLFQIVYARLLRLLYKLQVQMWRLIRKHDPQPYEESVLGFLEPRLRMLSRVLVMAHFLNSAVRVIIASGWNANPQLAKVLSDVVYCWYAGYFVDEAKRFFLPVWIPSLKADKRKGFIYNRSLSVLTWSICVLTVSEVISAYLRIPITSTLAFGGIGGLAIGLAGKDVLSNFFGGLMLLLAEPFIPGDMVTFQRNGVRCEGRVERVGWYQTRMRGRDTRPTYVPNGMFADTMVTNMDRITHRKFESNCQLRYADATKVSEILQGIKAALKDVPNVDLLSPFRVHLTAFTDTGLRITIVCYFATKSFDEFLYLQQLALLEVTRVVQNAGGTMTSVMHIDTSDPAPIPVSKLQGIVSGVAAQVGARDRDGLSTVFEEQDVARKIPLNGGMDDVNRAANASGAPGPRGGSV